MSHLEDVVREMLMTKAIELFAHYNVTCVEADSPPPAAEQLVGVLGFAGDHLSGSVLMAASAEAVATSNPIGDGVTRGWIAELVNQVVGRFKNALLRRGIDVAMSVPVVLTATRLVPMTSSAVQPIHLSVGAGHVTLWVEIVGDAELCAEAPDEEVALEGAAFLF